MSGRCWSRLAAAAMVAAGCTVATIAAGAAHADAPYPASGLVAGIAWDRGSYRSGGDGGDLWPVTAATDGRLYTAWGDGVVGCGAKVSYGVATTLGGPNANLQRAGCGPPGQGLGKIASLLAVGDTLYAIVNLQDRPWPYPDFQVWRSADHGRTWEKPAWRFSSSAGALRPGAFVNFGPGDARAPDGYAYMTAQKAVPDADQRAAYLMRAPRDSLGAQASYQYFAGTDAGGADAWSASATDVVPVFEDAAGVDGPEIVWDAGLGRFLLTAGHGGGGAIGVFEAPTMWGSWRTVDYEGHWLGMTGGEFLGLRFPTVWMQDSGRILWAVFSCYGPIVCGPFHDRFNLIRATLAVPEDGTGGGTPAPGAAVTTATAPRTDGAPTRTPGVTPRRSTATATSTPARADHGSSPATAGSPARRRGLGETAMGTGSGARRLAAQAACGRIAGNRTWTGIDMAVHGRTADDRLAVEVRGERYGEDRDRACRYDAGSGTARFDDQE